MKTTYLLSKIKSPQDIKNFSVASLIDLAGEIRNRIIEVLSVNGGHLASNLGVVELTVSLHKVFHSPLDRFLFDVSHQTYTHKILTGRNNRFNQIRKYKGLCGFANPNESNHDHFYAGHAGTALSLALGMAKNRDLQNDTEHILPIIGDAAFTCGMVLEALNNIPKNLKRFTIILNDNAMSISKNVGAITNILSRFLNNPTANKLYQEFENVISRVPCYGPQLAKHGQKVTESIKNLVSPAAFFEQYGVTYIGPIDGHDIKKMIQVLEALKDNNKPVILHVLTTKGKGMPEAMLNPITHHGAKPFNKDSGKFLPATSTRPTFPKIFGRHLLKMADNDPNVIAVTPAMSYGSCLDAFMEKYPGRCLDVGIAEAHSVTFCGGMAFGGKVKVVVSIYATFLQRAFDNLFHDVCLQDLPVLFCIDRAGLAGPDGSTHNGIYDIAFLNVMPNMVITQPRDGHVLKELLNSAFSWNQPTAIRYPNRPTEEYDQPLLNRELGTAEILTEGQDVLIIGLGHMCRVALEVREKLEKFGMYATVIDPVFIKPLDDNLFVQLLKTHTCIITIEEHSLRGGLGAIFNHFLMQKSLGHIRVLNFGVPDVFVEQGGYRELWKELGLNADQITQRIVHHFSFNKLYVARALL